MAGPSFESTSNVKEANSYENGQIYFAPQYAGDSAIAAGNPNAIPKEYIYAGAAVVALVLLYLVMK